MTKFILWSGFHCCQSTVPLEITLFCVRLGNRYGSACILRQVACILRQVMCTLLGCVHPALGCVHLVCVFQVFGHQVGVQSLQVFSHQAFGHQAFSHFRRSVIRHLVIRRSVIRRSVRVSKRDETHLHAGKGFPRIYLLHIILKINYFIFCQNCL